MSQKQTKQVFVAFIPSELDEEEILPHLNKAALRLIPACRPSLSAGEGPLSLVDITDYEDIPSNYRVVETTNKTLYSKMLEEDLVLKGQKLLCWPFEGSETLERYFAEYLPRCVFVTGVPLTIDLGYLRGLVVDEATFLDFYVPKSSKTVYKHYGFITFETEEGAAKIVQLKKIKFDHEKSKKKRKLNFRMFQRKEADEEGADASAAAKKVNKAAKNQAISSKKQKKVSTGRQGLSAGPKNTQANSRAMDGMEGIQAMLSDPANQALKMMLLEASKQFNMGMVTGFEDASVAALNFNKQFQQVPEDCFSVSAYSGKAGSSNFSVSTALDSRLAPQQPGAAQPLFGAPGVGMGPVAPNRPGMANGGPFGFNGPAPGMPAYMRKTGAPTLTLGGPQPRQQVLNYNQGTCYQKQVPMNPLGSLNPLNRPPQAVPSLLPSLGTGGYKSLNESLWGPQLSKKSLDPFDGLTKPSMTTVGKSLVEGSPEDGEKGTSKQEFENEDYSPIPVISKPKKDGEGSSKGKRSSGKVASPKNMKNSSIPVKIPLKDRIKKLGRKQHSGDSFQNSEDEKRGVDAKKVSREAKNHQKEFETNMIKVSHTEFIESSKRQALGLRSLIAVHKNHDERKNLKIREPSKTHVSRRKRQCEVLYAQFRMKGM